MTPVICNKERCPDNDQRNKQYDYEDDYDDSDHDDGESDDDLYILVVIPILSIIGGFLAFLFCRYNGCIFLALLTRLFGWIMVVRVQFLRRLTQKPQVWILH